MSADNSAPWNDGEVQAPASPAASAADVLGEPTPAAEHDNPNTASVGERLSEQLQQKIGNPFDGLAPKTPADYRFEPLNDASAFSPELDSAARAAFHAERFDAGTAATLVREWNKAAATPELNPAQKAAEQLHAERALRVAWGGDYESNLKLANAEVTRIATAHPNLPIKAMLASTSLGNSVYLIRTLVNRAQAAGRK